MPNNYDRIYTVSVVLNSFTDTDGTVLENVVVSELLYSVNAYAYSNRTSSHILSIYRYGLAVEAALNNK